ncbi:MAG TPA: hypothetical protein PL033_11485 [Candidatus Brocadiia bacterium]|nr:hypothetical protein [Candidatus Brocadiia bacterium]
MKVDMSPEAVTARLKQTAELTRLCLALKRDEEGGGKCHRKPGATTLRLNGEDKGAGEDSAADEGG